MPELDDLDLDTDPNVDPDADPDGPKVTLSRGQLRAMERDAKAARQARADAEAAQRELAILKSGIDVESPLGQFFISNFQGPWNADAIKAAFADLDTKPPAEPPAEPPKDEKDLVDLRRDLASEGIGDDGVPRVDDDPGKLALKEGKAVLDAGGSRDDAMATVFAMRAQAAAQGDKRVIWSPDDIGQ